MSNEHLASDGRCIDPECDHCAWNEALAMRDNEQRSEEKRVGSMPDYVSCPFCQEADFDLIGLKSHYLRGWCEVFNQTADPVAIIERGRQLLRKWNPCQKRLPEFANFDCIYEDGHEGQCDFKKATT